MRVVTWNIHKGIGGVDRRYRLERVVEVLADVDADIVMLQEVDRGVPRSRRHDQAAELGAALGYDHVEYAPNVTLKYGVYGNALLSRHPIRDALNIDLTWGVKKARGALCCRLSVTTSGGHRATVHVVNTHLGLSGIERRAQVTALLAHERLRHLHGSSRIVLGGDTNDWTGALPPLLGKHGYRCATGVGRSARLTFPSWRPVAGLDKLFVRGALTARHVHVPRSKVARDASDHRPLVVDLALGSTR